MNNTFDIKRFGNVVRRDGMSYFKNFGWTLVVLWSIPVGIWFMLFISGDMGKTMNSDRYGFFYFLMIVAMILVPSRLYKDCNDSRKGVQFAMLPASSLEKFLSMFIYCILVTPILYIVGAVSLDTIMVLIPGNNPYEGFVFVNVFIQDIFKIYLGDWGTLVMRLPFYQIFVVLSCISIFMFTNMLFKKRKVGKTIGVLAISSIIVIIVIVRVSILFKSWFDSFTYDDRIDFSKKVHYGFYIFNILLSIVMFYLTYYKIKKQTY